MSDQIIDVNLSVKVINGQLIAHLCIANTASKMVYLDDQTICYDNTIRGDYFRIKTEKGKLIDYTGMKVCREVNPESFLKLNVNEKLETDINLSEVYELKKGKKYTIQYSAFQPPYFEEQDLAKIDSNVIDIIYK
ncbi:hypothetical protein [Niastella populi]|uniref:Uncharacterized protein n=1 Tax=Niastella populi TaxID=550983 RepID=A0A1V9F5K3_9BACT|nr:hypothetical protein [Niastella populi]OQP53565.1 hypothetical protein A4R26_06195 [Niastella populi]